MAAPKFTTSVGYAGKALVLMARYKDAADADVVQAGVGSLPYEVWPKSNPKKVASSTLVVASTIYDTLQTGNGWNTEAWPAGFNLRAVLPGSLFPNEGETYRIVLRVVPASGEESDPIVHDHTTLDLTGS